MANRLDSYTLQFLGMERQELAYARDRFRRSARARHRVVWRLWARNRVVFLLGAVVIFGALGVPIVLCMKFLGTGLLLGIFGPVLGVAGVFLLSRWRPMHAFVDRWSREEQTARELYEMDRDSAQYAARLYRERWSATAESGQ